MEIVKDNKRNRLSDEDYFFSEEEETFMDKEENLKRVAEAEKIAKEELIPKIKRLIESEGNPINIMNEIANVVLNDWIDLAEICLENGFRTMD